MPFVNRHKEKESGISPDRQALFIGRSEELRVFFGEYIEAPTSRSQYHLHLWTGRRGEIDISATYD